MYDKYSTARTPHELTKLFEVEAVLAVSVKRYSSECEDLDVDSAGCGNVP